MNVCAVLLLSACGTFVRSIPEPSIYIRQISPRPHQAIFFEGPVPIECEVWISNVAETPLVLTAVELHSDRSGAFAFTTRTLPVTTTIPPGGTIIFNVSVWGWSRGGDFAAERPIPFAGKAWFSVGHARPQPVSFRIVL